MVARDQRQMVDYSVRALGALLMAQGLYAQYDPLSSTHCHPSLTIKLLTCRSIITGAQRFTGTLSPTVSGAREALFFPIVGGRNLMLGFAILSLSYAGERRALSILLACIAVFGMLDVWWCWTMGGGKCTALAIGMGVPGMLSKQLLRSWVGSGEQLGTEFNRQGMQSMRFENARIRVAIDWYKRTLALASDFSMSP